MWVGISTTVQYNIILGVNFPICILTSFFYVNELLCLLPDRANIKRPINILFFRVVDVISMLLSTFLVSAWWLLNKPWYLNDIICFFMTGTFMKLLKITSLKQGFIFLTIIFITDVLSMTIALNFLTNQSVDSLVEDQYNVPIMFEVQEFHMYLYKLCAWIPITAVLFSGMLIEFLHRFDMYINQSNNQQTATQVHIKVTFIFYLSGSVIWLIIRWIFYQSIPYSLFTFPFQIIGELLWAYIRRDLDTLWRGNFYDIHLR